MHIYCINIRYVMHKLYSMYNEARLSFGNWYFCGCVMEKYSSHFVCTEVKLDLDFMYL